MSYTRRFTKEITVYYSGSESYPASEHGGTVHYSGSKRERIEFDVTVDTEPFDDAIESTNHHVDLLTGSVVATEAAHVQVIDETTRQVGDTIIAGFFKAVQSEVTQQIVQLRTRSEALLIQLNKLAERCRAKKQQMGVDYQRISERYSKIFTDLNNELENRIYSIDEPVFSAARMLDNVGRRNESDCMVSTVSVSSGEHARIHSIIASNLVKKEAVKAIEKGADYLRVQYDTDRVLDRVLLPGGENATISSPFCVMEATQPDGISDRQVHCSPLLEKIDKAKLVDKLYTQSSRPLDESQNQVISEYFNANLAKHMSDATDSHAKRVAEMTGRLFDLSSATTPGK